MSNIQTHLQKLTKINKGDDVRSVAKSDRIHAMQELIKSMLRGEHIVTDRNSIRKKTGEGYHALSTNSSGGKIITERNPFEILLEEGSQFRVSPGTLNEIIPANIFNVFLYDPESTTYVVLHAQTDNYLPTSVTVESKTGPPDPPGHLANLAPAEFYVILGVIAFGVVFNVVTYNLNAIPVDVIHTLTSSPAPGRPYYDINYSWLISGV